ncbi:MAG TPA: hypothetical protein VJV76_08050 [Gaiellaceae bacterium]|nr:hypothetical protein [Gaiellaceae bacterium]
MRRPPLLFVPIAVVCGLLLGCGGSGGPPDTWSQTGRTVRAFWTLPSASTVNLRLVRAGTVAGCTTTAKGKSEPGTILIVGGYPAAFFRIGETLESGARARTVCRVSGDVTQVSYGASLFKHIKRR